MPKTRNPTRQETYASSQSVPNIIWQQILIATKMRLGARGPVGDLADNSLTFRVSPHSTGVYKFAIKLEPSDTYKVTLWRLQGAKAEAVETADDIYFDALGEALERLAQRESDRRVAGART